jgi:hypothetical protein
MEVASSSVDMLSRFARCLYDMQVNSALYSEKKDGGDAQGEGFMCH